MTQFLFFEQLVKKRENRLFSGSFDRILATLRLKSLPYLNLGERFFCHATRATPSCPGPLPQKDLFQETFTSSGVFSYNRTYFRNPDCKKRGFCPLS